MHLQRKICRRKYGLNDKNTKKSDYTKLRLTDDYEYESEKEEKETDKKPDTKEPPKKPTENSVGNLVNWSVKKKQIEQGIISKAF